MAPGTGWSYAMVWTACYMLSWTWAILGVPILPRNANSHRVGIDLGLLMNQRSERWE